MLIYIYTHIHTHRKRSVKIWEKACQWLAEHESRVRVENQRIAGEDFEVWRWIQVDPLQTEAPWPATGTEGGERGEDTTDGVKSKKGDWLGTALEDYPRSMGVKLAPPAGSPSPFIRLKNMFEATRCVCVCVCVCVFVCVGGGKGRQRGVYTLSF